MADKEKSSIMSTVIDVKWLVTILVPFIAWCISLEVRMSSGLPNRVANLETALSPVLIEYGVQQELIKRGIIKESQPSFITSSPSIPFIENIPNIIAEKQIEAIREEESSKVKEQFPNVKQIPAK